ncbi:hypothetical protein TRICHSKD4_3679 [Roseibium sp. TrichSKD4]|nr:hypothetical protein TRICHSKD4_3679 [Roseibium sp. TrichSKD4]
MKLELHVKIAPLDPIAVRARTELKFKSNNPVLARNTKFCG